MMASDQQRAWNRRRPDHGGVWQPRKLTTAQRAEITRRLAAGERAVDLAAEYGVTASRIRQLRSQ
ncbi:helix-turn-helix domain-containing protein [Streptomyces sp. bgisy154]|uniref:helix-turn-helix domain-containing protein n=1 Tax=Streptomyces sp. bgisy154 TaxID=3413794 RepID=UPI003D70516E